MAPKTASPAPGRGRHKLLFQDPEVRRWYENNARGSLITADTYLRRLGVFCEWSRTSPNALVAKEERALEALLMDFVSAEEKKGRTEEYILSSLKAVKSWLFRNHIVIPPRAIKVRGGRPTPRRSPVPTREQLKRILDAATVREKVCCVLVAQAGLRLETLGNYRGTDGLRIRDLPELNIRGKTVRFEQVPTRIVVRKELSKAGQEYFTFLGSEGCDYLKAYLETRLQAGERLTEDSDIIHPIRREKQFIYTLKISEDIRLTFNKIPGFQGKWRPYDLRHYFATRTWEAETKKGVARSFTQFWMGHVTRDTKGMYDAQRGDLDTATVEEMREQYQRCHPFLSTLPTKEEENVSQEVNRQMLKLAEYADSEIARIDLTDSRLVMSRVREKIVATVRGRQEVVEKSEMEQRLAAGWTYVATLNDHQVVLTSPATGGTSATPSSSATGQPSRGSPSLPRSRT